MSIFPVKISEWYGAYKYRELYRLAEALAEGRTCSVCGADVTIESMWAYHSFPYGYFMDDVWCSEDCLLAESK